MRCFYLPYPCYTLVGDNVDGEHYHYFTKMGVLFPLPVDHLDDNQPKGKVRDFDPVHLFPNSLNLLRAKFDMVFVLGRTATQLTAFQRFHTKIPKRLAHPFAAGLKQFNQKNPTPDFNKSLIPEDESTCEGAQKILSAMYEEGVPRTDTKYKRNVHNPNFSSQEGIECFGKCLTYVLTANSGSYPEYMEPLLNMPLPWAFNKSSPNSSPLIPSQADGKEFLITPPEMADFLTDFYQRLSPQKGNAALIRNEDLYGLLQQLEVFIYQHPDYTTITEAVTVVIGGDQKTRKNFDGVIGRSEAEARDPYCGAEMTLFFWHLGQTWHCSTGEHEYKKSEADDYFSLYHQAVLTKSTGSIKTKRTKHTQDDVADVKKGYTGFVDFYKTFARALAKSRILDYFGLEKDRDLIKSDEFFQKMEGKSETKKFVLFIQGLGSIVDNDVLCTEDTSKLGNFLCPERNEDGTVCGRPYITKGVWYWKHMETKHGKKPEQKVDESPSKMTSLLGRSLVWSGWEERLVIGDGIGLYDIWLPIMEIAFRKSHNTEYARELFRTKMLSMTLDTERTCFLRQFSNFIGAYERDGILLSVPF